MGMSIAERMARQARAAAATHVNQVAAPRAASTVSAAQRIARQGAVVKETAVSLSGLQPPPDRGAAPSMSAAERISKQAIVAAAQRSGGGNTNINERVIADLRKKYEAFLAKLDAEMESAGPLFFVPGNTTEEKPAEVTDQVNGISTAEGEMVVEAQPSEPVPNMPFQANPLISGGTKKSRRKKASTEENAETD